VPLQITLTIAVELELADSDATGDGVLEHTGEDGSSLPRHVFRHTDVDRQQPPDTLAGHGHAGAAELVGAPGVALTPAEVDMPLPRQVWLVDVPSAFALTSSPPASMVVESPSVPIVKVVTPLPALSELVPSELTICVTLPP
jgi:hypothetical protein